jgi:hypothetical protein
MIENFHRFAELSAASLSHKEQVRHGRENLPLVLAERGLEANLRGFSLLLSDVIRKEARRYCFEVAWLLM